MKRTILPLLLLALPLGGAKGQSVIDGGPLDGRYAYVLCFRDPRLPDKATALLRRKGVIEKNKGSTDSFLYARTFGNLDLEDGRIWWNAIEPSGVVYEDSKSPGVLYRLRPARSKTATSIPAWVLATFVGEATGSPILYDSRSLVAAEKISVPAGEDPVDIKKAKDLLAQVSTLKEIALEDGRKFHTWTSRPDAGAIPTAKRLPEPALLIPRSESAPKDLREKPLTITSGTIPLMSVLQLASRLTGLAVYSAVVPAALEHRDVRMINDVPDVNRTVLEKILEINGIKETSLPGVGKVLLVNPDEGG